MGRNKSTTYGYWRSRGDGLPDSFPALSLLAMPFSFTMGTAQVSIGKLPVGAMPMMTVNHPTAIDGGPQYDIGTSTASHGVARGILANGQSATAFVNPTYPVATAGGAPTYPLTSQTEIFGRGSDATGGAIIAGTAKGAVLFVMSDDIF